MKTQIVEIEVSEILFKGVKNILSKRSTPWIGTISQLNSILLRDFKGQIPQNWPKSPSALRVAFNKVINRLRNSGVSIRFNRANDRIRTRLVRLASGSKNQ